MQALKSESLVRLRLITHNARLVHARKERGMTQPIMAQAVGIAQYRLHAIETLRVSPTDEEQIKIACILEKPLDYLFPEELLSAIDAGIFSRRKVELAAPQLISLTEARHLLISDGSAVEEEVETKLLAETISEVLKTLTPREQNIIGLRFGFDGQSRTLESAGRELGMTRERIRQIEAKALRKLRHPSRTRKLKDFW